MKEGRGHGALVTAWNSSFRPGERRQVTVEAGQQESLGSHWSGRRKTAPGPPNFLLQGAGRAEGSWAAPRIPPGGPGCWARQGTGQPAGQVFGGRPRRGLRPPALPPAPAQHGPAAEPAARPAPSPAARPAPRPPRSLLQSRDRGPSQRRARNLPRPLPPPVSGEARQGASDNGNGPMGSPEG